jgi:hypothetical protein
MRRWLPLFIKTGRCWIAPPQKGIRLNNKTAKRYFKALRKGTREKEKKRVHGRRSQRNSQ